MTAIARPNSTAKLPDGLNVVHVDYSGDDDTALVEALKGQQALLITMAVFAPKDTVSKIVRAAAKASVSYVQPNWYGHDAANDALLRDTFLLETRDKICAEIKGLGVSSYLLLSSGFWYEFSLGGGPNRYGFDFKQRSLVLYDEGNVAINTSTWPQCGRALASMLSLKELPDDENDKSPTLSQFRNGIIYISSFRLSQRDMFESVKRVTKTIDADWIIIHESVEERFNTGRAELQKGSVPGFTKMLYARMFFPNGDGDHETSRGLHNGLLDLPKEDLDEYTAEAIRMAENGEVSH